MNGDQGQVRIAIQDTVRRDVWIAPIAGGTDLAGVFLAGTPTLPMRVGEMQCRALGAGVYAFDEASGEISNHSECMVTIGGGARHIAVHPDGKRIFCNEEAGARVTAYDWDAEAGVLTPTQTLSTLPENHGLPEVFTAECSLNATAVR